MARDGISSPVSMTAPKPRRITLKDLSAILGVSTATVSNAFNRPDQLSPAMRERVLTEAARLGYSGPDAKARSLRTGKSQIIAVILAETLTYSLNDAVASALLSGIAEVLDAHDHTMMLLAGRDRLANTVSRARIADGIIGYGMMPEPERLQDLLRGEHQPVVTIDCDLNGYPAIHVDDQRSAYRLAHHALARRPARIGIVALRLTADYCNGPVPDGAEFLPTTHSITRLRLAGYEQALAEHTSNGASCEVALWNVEENVHAMAAPVIEPILDLPAGQRPDVLLCMSDRIALTVLTLAEARGLRVPEDIAITGFDGIAEGQYRKPRLTTVLQDSARKGRLAARQMLGLESLRGHVIEGELIIGESCP